MKNLKESAFARTLRAEHCGQLTTVHLGQQRFSLIGNILLQKGKFAMEKGQFLKNDILVYDSTLETKTKTKENKRTKTIRRPKTNRNTSRDTSLSMTPVLTLPTSFCRHVPGST